MECGYCTTFNESTIRTQIGKIKTRFCMWKNDYVSREDAWCEHFNLNEWFFCERSNYQVNFDICQARRERDFSDCSGCSQIRTIIDFKRGAGRRRSSNEEAPKRRISRIENVQITQEAPRQRRFSRLENDSASL